MENETIRFGDYAREVGFSRYELSYNDLNRSYSQKKAGRQWLGRPWSREWLLAFFRLFLPYVKRRIFEQIVSVIPLLMTLLIFQFLILRQPPQDGLGLTAGWLLVVSGLAFFLDGLRLGVMPLTEQIGTLLPRKLTLLRILGTVFVLGLLVTLAEPSIFALQSASAASVPSSAKDYLSQHALRLLVLIGLGIGLAACLQLLRAKFSWSLRWLLLLQAGVMVYIIQKIIERDGADSLIALAFDSGAAATGPITVPLLLALGIGLASGLNRRESAFSGLGTLTLASQVPVLILLGGFWLWPGQATLQTTAPEPQSLFVGLISGVGSLIPLLIVMMCLLFWLTGTYLPAKGFHKYGFAMCLLGLILIQVGMQLGVIPLGASIGTLIAGTFSQVPLLLQSPLYSETVGQVVTLTFVSILGAGCALAEPALHTLGRTLEDQSTGAMRESTLVRTVALGVGCGFAFGAAQLIFARPFVSDFACLYGLALTLSLLARDEYVQIAWDCGVVTIGLVTVPVMVSLGVGFSNALGSSHSFGLLSMCMICPVITVLFTGIIADWKRRQGGKLWNVK